ncbi:hypothetical protein B0H13DRAFT_2356985 [Mycena leptocephala]|nr:hypothetical protein B0H13DRAFT_2356985 [Mycena leptocephala]
MSAGDQCAIGPDGNLLLASSINCFDAPDNKDPLLPTSTSTKATSVTDHFPCPTSNRIPRTSSARASDPNNIDSLKHQASRDLDQLRSTFCLRSSTRTELDDDGDGMPELEDVSDSEDEGDSNPEAEDDEDEEEEDVEAASEALQPL